METELPLTAWVELSLVLAKKKEPGALTDSLPPFLQLQLVPSILVEDFPAWPK
jgi:hypothetical protein